MTKYLNLTKRGILAFLVVMLLSFILAGLTHAETNESVSKYGISFPIGELGNCANLADSKECFEYIERLAKEYARS